MHQRGLDLAVAKISRVRGPQWIVFRLKALRKAIGLVVIQTNRVMRVRTTGTDSRWCAEVIARLQGMLNDLDVLMRQAQTDVAPAPLPRKLTHRARKSNRDVHQ